MNKTPDRHVDDEKIIDLLNDLTPAAAADAIAGHLETCQECEARYVRLAREHETLRARANVALGGGSGVERGRRRVLTRARVVVAAGAVAAAIVAAILLPRLSQSPSDEAAMYWMPAEPQLVTLRTRDANDRMRTLSSGIEAYEHHRLDEAVRLLRGVTARTPHDEYKTIANLYLASALVNMGQYEEATALFSQNDVLYLPYRWRQQARWVMFLAHEGLGQEQEAMEFLEPLLGDTGDLGQRARAAKAKRGAG